MLYLLESENYYKIGFTANEETLEKRLKHYKTHNPDFVLIGLYNGNKKEEKEIHLQCKDFLHRGEWFKKDNFVLDTINTLNKLPNCPIERYVVKIVGNFNYKIPDEKDNINRELYTYHELTFQGYLLSFCIFDSEHMLVTIINSFEKKQLYFYSQNIKKYYCDYSEKSNNRLFRGVLFDSDYIILSVRDGNFNRCYEELISTNVKKIYNCFTREDFEIW